MTTTNLPARRTPATVDTVRATPVPQTPNPSPLLTVRMFLGLFLLGLSVVFFAALMLSISTMP